MEVVVVRSCGKSGLVLKKASQKARPEGLKTEHEKSCKRRQGERQKDAV